MTIYTNGILVGTFFYLFFQDLSVLSRFMKVGRQLFCAKPFTHYLRLNAGLNMSRRLAHNV